MSDNKPTMVVDKVKVLSISEGSYEWKGETRKQWTLVLQDQNDTTKVLTGQLNKLTDEVKQDAIIGPCWVYEREANGQKFASFFFPTEKSGGDGGGKGGGFQKEDPELKLTGLAYSYARDVLLQTNTETWNWETYFQKGDETAAAMRNTYKALKG